MSDAALLAMAARAWHDHEILVVRVSRLDDPIDRQMARAIAERLYGKRKEPGTCAP